MTCTVPAEGEILLYRLPTALETLRRSAPVSRMTLRSYTMFSLVHHEGGRRHRLGMAICG